MVQRPATSRFMPSVWVFPGGAVDAEDADPDGTLGATDAWRTAALRELIEETGIWLTTGGTQGHPLVSDAFVAVRQAGVDLDPDALIYFANWITPEALPIRFDTRFFLAVADAGVDGEVDGDELVALAWVEPLTALEQAEDGSFDVAFPTRKTLELLASRRTAVELAHELRGIEDIPPVQPRLHVTEGAARIVLPGEDVFDEIEAEQSDPDLLVRLARVAATGGRVPPELRRRR